MTMVMFHSNQLPFGFFFKGSHVTGVAVASLRAQRKTWKKRKNDDPFLTPVLWKKYIYPSGWERMILSLLPVARTTVTHIRASCNWRIKFLVRVGVGRGKILVARWRRRRLVCCPDRGELSTRRTERTQKGWGGVGGGVKEDPEKNQDSRVHHND